MGENYIIGVIISLLLILAACRIERSNNLLGDWQDVHYSIREWYHVRRYREYIMIIICFIPILNFIVAASAYILAMIHKK